MMTDWFIPEMEEFETQRALLNLDLNRAIRYYRELVVPGIGGVWFVRQLSWAVTGIQLAQKINRFRQVIIANAIEALACKLAWKLERSPDQAVRGERAFKKYPNVWSFNELTQPKYYVRIPYRSSTVRALPGLKLTDGPRFNSMVLTPNGSELAEAFLSQKKGGQGGRAVRKAITGWIGGDEIGNIVDGLWRDGVTDEEKKISLDRLRANSSDSFADKERRARLIEAFGKYDELNLASVKKNLQSDQVIEIETAQAFDELLETGRNLIYECAEIIDQDSIQVAGNLADKAGKMLKKLRLAADEFQEYANKSKKQHTDASDFTNEISSCDSDEKLLLMVIARDGVILKTEGNKVERGHLFTRRKKINENNENGNREEFAGKGESSTEHKIRQLFELWRDCL